ncbi:MAG: MFS transporter [Treponema sp.]|nr:MFS transporter [Treponema sp.]
MATLFLILIYLTFISLGLPDALLGAAWPVMRLDLGMPLDGAGMIFIIISGGTIISSFCSGWVVGRFGTGKVTTFSVLFTAAALLGSSFGHTVWWFMLLAVPLGLGAGSVDAALNNYVATHYKAHHMSWLHCFWGVGAFIGPIIIGARLRQDNNWRGAYLSLGLMQAAISVILFIALPMWKKAGANAEAKGGDAGTAGKTENSNDAKSDTAGANTGNKNVSAAETASGNILVNSKSILRIPGVWQALLTFFLYCSCEYTVGLWGASFLSEMRGFEKPAAASAVSLYYAGITIGRFFSGLLNMRFKGQQLIRGGLCIILLGGILFLLPLPAFISLPALLLIGLGCSPVFPNMIQLTPERFGAENSQKIIGWQMGCAYTGITVVPPLLGIMAAHISMLVVPAAILCYVALMLFLSERINVKCRASAKLTEFCKKLS